MAVFLLRCSVGTHFLEEPVAHLVVLSHMTSASYLVAHFVVLPNYQEDGTMHRKTPENLEKDTNVLC